VVSLWQCLPGWPAGKLRQAARALYAPERRKGAGGFDLTYFYAPDDVKVWPDNWPAFVLFSRVQTQWRQSHNGPTGLDYSAVYPLLDRSASEQDDWDQMLDDIRTMELAALEQIRENMQ
jgi:hypothetical protein